ncbi:MAG: LD-carboxypeptidase [Clostridiales bacterium]|nr:LD-carboxypeptidase [Clostridiales bacterium]
MRYPKFLQPTGTIGFIAPSYGCTSEPYLSAFNHALEKFQGMGYNTWLGPNCYVSNGVGISNEPRLCGEELNAAYAGADCDALISCGGGELMCETIEYIDFDAIKKAEPKWYMGFSDNTNFTFLSATLADTAAIYGPCAPAFGMEPWHESVGDAFDLLCGKKNEFSSYDKWEREGIRDEEHPYLPYNLTEPTVIKATQESVKMRGRLIGGCMDCLVNMLGTRFERTREFVERYAGDGLIWFLESCDLNIMSIRRALWEMKNAGWFEHARGFLFGRPLCFGDEMFGNNQYEAETALLSEYGVPIIMDLDIGHLPPMMPIVTGAMADVWYSDGKFRIRYDFM